MIKFYKGVVNLSCDYIINFNQFAHLSNVYQHLSSSQTIEKDQCQASKCYADQFLHVKQSHHHCKTKHKKDR